jgi:hypothetical protein
MGEALCPGELPEDLTLFSRRNILGRGEMVGNQNDPIPVEYLFGSDLLKSLNGKRGCDVISKGQIDPDIENFSRRNLFFPGMGG